MCYNCGCGMPNNDMGNSNNLTNEAFKRAAEAAKQPLHVAKKNARALLEKVLAAKQPSDEKTWKP